MQSVKHRFFSTTSFPLILYASDKIFRFPGRNLKPLHVSAKGIPDPKWSLYVSRKKFAISESRLIEGDNIIYNVLRANGKAFTLQVYNCLNFPRLLGFLKITCDLMSDRSRNSRRTAAAIRGTVFTSQIFKKEI